MRPLLLQGLRGPCVQICRPALGQRCLPDVPDGARICNVARSERYFVMNALEPLRHTPARTASIYAHDGEHLVSTVEPGDLGIPVRMDARARTRTVARATARSTLESALFSHLTVACALCAVRRCSSIFTTCGRTTSRPPTARARSTSSSTAGRRASSQCSGTSRTAISPRQTSALPHQR